jgi:hypothetical protein
MSEVAETKINAELNVKAEEIPVMNEHLTSSNEVKLELELEEEKNSMLAEDKKEFIEEKEIPKEKDEKKLEENSVEYIKSFIQLFELFLSKEQSNLVKFNLKLTPEIQQYFLLLCKECPELFGTFEQSLKTIIVDDKINSKDIPDILLLVSKVYNILKSNKGIPNVEPYEIIKTLLHVAVIVYLESCKSVNKNENSLLLLDLLNIVDSAIDLIKITPIVPKKFGCFFKC